MKKNKIIKYLLYSIFWFFYIMMLFLIDWFIIINLIFIAIYLFIIIKIWLNNTFLTSKMSLYNTHIFGKKGRGKDITTQIVIVRRFKKRYNKIIKQITKNYNINNPDIDIETYISNYFYNNPLYLSNISYGYGGKIIDIKELELIDLNTNKPITYNDIIDGSYKTMNIKKIKQYEGLDLYISDAQLGLPNTEHNTLDRLYPWLPVFIALSRQLYNMNVTVNTQEYNRLWIKLRGQQDIYIKALDTMPINKSFLQKIWQKIPILKKYIFIKIRYFEEQQSAENNILPFKAASITNEAVKNVYLSAGQATKEQFEATHGKIKNLTVSIKISNIKYDTRIYHLYLFGYESPL